MLGLCICVSLGNYSSPWQYVSNFWKHTRPWSSRFTCTKSLTFTWSTFHCSACCTSAVTWTLLHIGNVVASSLLKLCELDMKLGIFSLLFIHLISWLFFTLILLLLCYFFVTFHTYVGIQTVCGNKICYSGAFIPIHLL